MSNIERTDTNVGNIKKDIENVRSFLFKLEDETELKLVEKENYDKLVKRIKELEETKKYIVQLTDEQYRNLVDVIRKEVKKEYEQRIKDKIEKLKDTAKRIAGTYQYADSGDDLLEKKNRVIELRNKAEALENFLGG